MPSRRAFVDTNVFLRYVTNDLPSQAGAVERLLKRAAAGEVQLVTNALVVGEIVWTLQSYYELERSAVTEIILSMLNTPGLEVEDADVILQAIVWFEEERVDFIDAYAVAWMTVRDIVDVYSFDRKHFKRFEQIALMVPS